jgi:methylated-DNA-[protein]-cysteine S-methyltransferase
VNTTYFTDFETPFGTCTLVWTARGIAAIFLPEHHVEDVPRHRHYQFSRRVKMKPSNEASRAIDQLTMFLEGKLTHFTSLELDYSEISKFYVRVFECARSIPFGTVLSYGELAHQLGSPTATRAVGQALARNRWPLVVPCHRVVAKSGNLTGFSAGGGIATKRRLLQIEGHVFNRDGAFIHVHKR